MRAALCDGVIYTALMQELPRLEDRFALAACSTAAYRCAELYDVSLRQMRFTWAVPRLSRRARIMMLLGSHLIECVQWAFDHRNGIPDALHTYCMEVARSGFLKGLNVLVPLFHCSGHRFTGIIRELFKYYHVEQAITFYTQHVKPDASDGNRTRYTFQAICACHPLADAFVLRLMPHWTDDELRTEAFYSSVFERPYMHIYEYHWNAIRDVRDAIRCMAIAMTQRRLPRAVSTGYKFALEHAVTKGMDQITFDEIWSGHFK